MPMCSVAAFILKPKRAGAMRGSGPNTKPSAGVSTACVPAANHVCVRVGSGLEAEDERMAKPLGLVCQTSGTPLVRDWARPVLGGGKS